ncbi:Radical SAM domain protein [Isosphaera pallida ATCC 43644]|uniref:Radical SAM domain protein n=1 Tax=Isosphaera pallida (strain ATCC 43644 / DSM 9630 / IS1B) TaxID=575540 RepID=E8QX77_ISOPI|nr:TIGR03960 family B12-binding radical SAM protein [Isosphaera pallida]ADV60910.1 Radical SAM domain protein [Isosphaera pallida ATCC 43644]
MLNAGLKEFLVARILPRVRTPGQYLGGERQAIRKDHRAVKGTVCLAFPDTYALGMSHHGLQVLYSLINARDDWACERAFTPLPDFENELRDHGLPLYSLETFTPLNQFDILGFSLQYEICYTNVLTMIDLGGLPLHAEDRGPDDTLVIAGGPGAQNPELLAPFVDLFIIGDGETSLPVVCDLWIEMNGSGMTRAEKLARIVRETGWSYAPCLYEPIYKEDGTLLEMRPLADDLPREIHASVIREFDAIPLPVAPIIPLVETAHDRIALEIMRGCPWQCRFCQSTVIKRPLRARSVETVVQAALDSYRKTGYDEISLLSLSSSDYPHFEELVTRMSEIFTPLGVKISLPSLRITEMLKRIPALLQEGRRSGLTLAPEVARDDMREQIRKPINNQDLYDGAAEAFRRGWRRVKLYFLIGLPGERPADLDGIVELAERLSRLGKETTGRFAEVTASVSNFVPKPHTPYQWNGQRDRNYFEWAHRYLKSKVKLPHVKIKCHDIETSLLEGILTRGDRRVAPALEEAWRRGARLDAWREYHRPEIWEATFRDLGIDVAFFSQRERPLDEVLPWDHIQVKKGRTYLAKEQTRSLAQLEAMAAAV